MNMTMTLMLIRTGDIDDNDDDDGGDGDDDGGEPVTHEVEVERKLMCQLDSHCHLMDDHHQGKENLNLSRKKRFKFSNTEMFNTQILTPIEAVVSPLAGVQRSDPGFKFNITDA